MEQKRRSNFWYGVICLLLGSLWLLHTMELLSSQLSEYFYTWRFLLLVLGSVLMVRNRNSGFAIIILALGVLGTAFHFWQPPSGWENYIPPILLIGAGLVLLLRNITFSSSDEQSHDDLNKATILGNCSQQVKNVLFKGGGLSVVLGKNEIDFTQSHLGQEKVEIQTFTVLGTNTLIVPVSWNVQLDVIDILGKTTDLSVNAAGNDYKEGALIIKGVNVLGQVKIIQVAV